MTAARPMTIRFDHVRLDVADIAAAERFYRSALGLSEVVRYELPDRTILQLALDGRPPGVELWAERGLRPAPHPTQHIAFSVSDVPSLTDKMRSLGYPIVKEPFRIGAETVAFVTDPDGHQVEFNDFRGRQVDEPGHVQRLIAALPLLDSDQIDRWAGELAPLLSSGHRLLVAGNGGSAAQAQHLSSELVGRFEQDRRALSAIALHADSSTVTAVGNDYGFEEVFARQVRAHGRPGDVLVVLSTSGRSRNLCAAVLAAARAGLRTWALTGPIPNPLSRLSESTLHVPVSNTATVQECHLVAVHLLCAAVDRVLLSDSGRTSGAAAARCERPTVRRPQPGAPSGQEPESSTTCAGPR